MGNGFLLGQGGGGASGQDIKIKSIQSGSYTTTATSGTITINEVDVDNAFVILTGHNTAGNLNKYPRIYLSSSTTISFTTGGGTGAVIHYMVVEFEPGVIKSVQQGTITNTSKTISAVNLDKTILIWNGWTGSYLNYVGGLYLYNATTIKLDTNSGSSNATYAIVEFN